MQYLWPVPHVCTPLTAWTPVLLLAYRGPVHSHSGVWWIYTPPWMSPEISPVQHNKSGAHRIGKGLVVFVCASGTSLASGWEPLSWGDPSLRCLWTVDILIPHCDQRRVIHAKGQGRQGLHQCSVIGFLFEVNQNDPLFILVPGDCSPAS